MKKISLFCGFILLISLWTVSIAQEYFTLPEIREQSAKGWHETYTDKYGRKTVVDIDVEVYGEETAPVLKVGWGKYGKFADDNAFKLEKNHPVDRLMEAKKRGGKSTYIYEWVKNMKVNLNEPYGENYENDLSLQEVYQFAAEKLKEHGMPVYDYLYEMPEKFSVVYSINPRTNNVLVPAFYEVLLYMKKRGLPIFNNAADSYANAPSPWYDANMCIVMLNQNEYVIYEPVFEEEDILSEDIPLCSLEKIIQSIEQKIQSGHIQNVVALRFGYSIYTDPTIENVEQFSGYDANCYYLVPSWVIECIFVDNPKKNYDEVKTRMITINAQTGEMLDRFDKSYKGRGDARYKGFISWDDVKK